MIMYTTPTLDLPLPNSTYSTYTLTKIKMSTHYKKQWSLSTNPSGERAPMHGHINLLVESLPPTHLVREHPRPHQFISGVSLTNPSGERAPTATSIY